MKICHITDYLPKLHRKSGGAEAATFNLIDSLSKVGVQSVVLATPTVNPLTFDIRGFKLYQLKISERIIGWKLSFLKRFFQFDWFTYRQALAILKKERPEVVHFHNFPILSFSLLSAAKKNGLPTVLTVYDYWYFCPKRILVDEGNRICHRYHGKHCLKCYQPKFFPLSEKVVYYYRKKLFDFYLKKIDCFVVLSRASGNILTEYGIKKEKIKVIHLFVKEQPADQQTQLKPVTLFAGWLTPTKGADVLIKAWPKVINKFPDVKLVILGMKPDQIYLEKLQRLIKDNNLVDKVIFNQERVSKEKFESYFNQALIVAIPETWPNMSPVIMAEAMAAKKTILASDIGGIPEFIRDNFNGYLAPAGQPEAWAKKIIDILSNLDKLNKIQENAYQTYLENFTHQKIISKTLDLYELLGRKK